MSKHRPPKSQRASTVRCSQGCCYWTGKVWVSIEAINQYRDRMICPSIECPASRERLLPGGKTEAALGGGSEVRDG